MHMLYMSSIRWRLPLFSGLRLPSDDERQSLGMYERGGSHPDIVDAFSSDSLLPLQMEFGAPFPPMFAALLRYRMPAPALLRRCALAHRFTPPELLKEGLVDEIVDGEMVIKRAVEIGQIEGGKVGGGSWGGMKVRTWSCCLGNVFWKLKSFSSRGRPIYSRSSTTTSSKQERDRMDH